MAKFTRESRLEYEFKKRLKTEFSQGRGSRRRLNEIFSIGSLLKIVCSTRGTYLQLERFSIIDNENIKGKTEELNCLLAKISFSLCLKTLKFLNTDVNDIKLNPEKYIIKSSDIKYLTELKNFANVKRFQSSMPNNINAFKNLVCSVLEENKNQMLESYHYLPKDAQDKVSFIVGCIDLMKSKIENGSYDIEALFNIRDFSNLNNKVTSNSENS